MTSSGELPRWTFWVFIVRGSVALTLGTALLLSGKGLYLLGSFVGAYWVIGGLLTVRWALGNREARGSRLGAFVGVLALVVGIVLVLRKLVELLVEQGLLLDVIGLAGIGMGILRLSGKFHDDQLETHRPRARYRLVVGTLDVVLGAGVILVSNENLSAVRLVLGIWGILVGTFLVLDALRLRRVVQAKREAP